MKALYVLLALLLVNYAHCQEVRGKTLTFSNALSFTSEADSIKFYKSYEFMSPDVLRMYMAPVSVKFHIKKDSILICKYLEKKTELTSMYLITADSVKEINAVTGRIKELNSSSNHTSYSDFDSYTRIKNEDTVIANNTSLAWISKASHGWNKIWLVDTPRGLEYPRNTGFLINKYAGFLFKDNIVNKQIRYIKDGRIITSELVVMEPLKEQDFNKVIKRHTIVDIKTKYAPIEQNIDYDSNAIKIGEKIPNLYFRNVFDDNINSIYNSNKNTKFLIIEFWGTWCVPCMEATEKIKTLKKGYSKDHLNIISLNAHDRNIEKLKGVIKKKSMNWNHGYATKKILSILNSGGSYPRAIVVDSENNILFKGNPLTDFEKIKAIISN
ncbi:TlpA disulfide reductase family protein [Winogradskyella sp.]|uniref:TlpA family protein disulfide reductase n=1 Tax=Winogradskyella sp. TaxID=1883156 RepID=UPI002626CCB7|nr:TlpA disulfide reductase family protein [Winogradskyella sp.]